MNGGGGGEMGTPERREGGKNYSLPEISKIQKELHTHPQVTPKRNSIDTKTEETDFRNYERSEHDRRNKIHRRT